jgi:hypothetical protein
MEQIGKVFPSVFRPYLRRDDRLAEVLASAWPIITGKLMAAHSRPVAFARGTLTLTSGCPSWAAQLRGLSKEIRAEVNSFLGAPRVERLLVRYVPDGSVAGADAMARTA